MQLGVQIAVGYLLVILMTLIHAAGIVAITKLLKLEDSTLRRHRLDFGAFALLTSMALSLFALHTLEIGLFALFYLAVGAFREIEPALYFSTESYTTLGPGIQLPIQWRLVGAVEGLAG
ncbi:MAG: two pore domain potassium channel family protein, partial [Sphingomonas sp.]